MTKFETILRLSEIKGFSRCSDEFSHMGHEQINNIIHMALGDLIDDLSEEFQEKQHEIKLPKLTDYESYDDNSVLNADHDKLSKEEINQLIDTLRNHRDSNKPASF